MSRRLDIPESLRRNQALASDPNASIWVSANAGSGKTHVLTQRVLRLMLDGAKPAQILGLTFTKAAAANMAGRIFTTLAEWTSLDDEALTAKIIETGAARPGNPALAFARQLFARAIETPGGLKNSDPARLLRAAVATVPVRGQRPRAFPSGRRARVRCADDRGARPGHRGAWRCACWQVGARFRRA